MKKRGRPISEKVTIDSQFFKAVLKNKNISIRKLQRLNICNEKTVRNALREGKMSKNLLLKIAKGIDVDPDVLSGKSFQIFKNNEKAKDEIVDNISKKTIYVKKYPVLNDELNNAISTLTESVCNILPLYNIISKQYENLSKDKKYDFIEEILDSFRVIVPKYFDKDANDNPTTSNFVEADKLIDDWKEYDEGQEIIAELKKEYKNKNLPPEVIDKFDVKKIKKLSDFDILDSFYQGFFNNK